MSEIYTPHTNTETSLEQAGREAVELSEQNQADKLATDEEFQQRINESARTLAQIETYQKNILKGVTDTAVASGLIAGTGIGAILGFGALDNHVANVEKEGQQHIQEAQQAQDQIDFENGTRSGKVTIEVSQTVPTPEQIIPADEQPLENLPSPITH